MNYATGMMHCTGLGSRLRRPAIRLHGNIHTIEMYLRVEMTSAVLSLDVHIWLIAVKLRIQSCYTLVLGHSSAATCERLINTAFHTLELSPRRQCLTYNSQRTKRTYERWTEFSDDLDEKNIKEHVGRSHGRADAYAD